MENWRGFSRSEKSVLEDASYITGTLGIKLQLDESKNPIISESLREQILTEHMLFEGFLGSLWQAAKDTAGKVKRLTKTLYRIYKNPKALKSFIYIARKNMNKIAKVFKQVLTNLLQVDKIPELIKKGISKALDVFNSLLEKANNSLGWKGAMIIVSTLVILKFVYKKIGSLAEELIEISAESGATALAEQHGKKLLDFLNNFFGVDLVSKIGQTLTDWKSWLGWIGPIVGGVNVVADGLDGVTSKVGGDTALTGGNF